MRAIHSFKNAILLFMISSPVFAQLEKVNTLLEKVRSALEGAALVTVICAILWVGYKILWGGQTLRECAPILIGGAIIGAAAQIAALLVG